MSINSQIASHYTEDDALELLDQRLRAQGIDPEHPTIEALAPFDNFHSRSIAATLDQIALASFPAGARVVDVGGGLGGPARLLASKANCRVTVLDLTPSFIENGRILTERLGMSDRVDFVLGDATEMPFDNGSFDGAWTQHSTMNIPDKASLFSEIHRVLTPEATIVLHEVVAGDGGAPIYPMPFATSPTFSDLRSAHALRNTIVSAGFRETFWEDETALTLAAIAGNLEALAAGPGSLLGPSFRERLQNFASNLESGSVAVVRASFERVA